jgi:hypothetical protein
MLDPWVQWAKDRGNGRDPSRAIADEVKRHGRAMLVETFVAIALALVVGTRVVFLMGQRARGFTLFASAFLTVWTSALAITLLVLRRGTYRLGEDTPRGHLELSRRRLDSQLRLVLPMRLGIGAMGLFLAVWLPWLTWVAPHSRRQPLGTGLVRIAVAAFLVAFLFAVLGRLEELTRERIAAVDSLLGHLDKKSKARG